MSVKWTEYKGTKILIVDYRNQDFDSMIQTLEEACVLYKNSKEKIRAITYFQDVHVSREFMSKAKSMGKEILHPKSEKAAVIGIEGLKKILLQAYNTFAGGLLKPFSSEQEAKEWLIK